MIVLVEWGVLLAIKSKISSTLINSTSHLDLLTVSIVYGKTFIINLLYIPPSANLTYLSDFESILCTLNSNDHLLLLGDLNFPDVNWSTLSGHTPLSTHFCDLIFELNLNQQVTEHTHKGGNLLDVILTYTVYIETYQSEQLYLTSSPLITINFDKLFLKLYSRH